MSDDASESGSAAGDHPHPVQTTPASDSGSPEGRTEVGGDLHNLLAALPIAIVVVDQDLRVRRFNAAAEKLLELGPHDVGRPVGHIQGRIEVPRMKDNARKVIETSIPIAQEVQDKEGSWNSIVIRPYRTADDHIAGAVITFQDIDALKRGLEASEEARQHAEALVETVREPLIVLDADLRVQRATAAFYETFQVSREETEGRLLYDLGNGQWNRPRLRELLGAALFRSEAFHDHEIEHEFPIIGRRTMRLNARRIARQQIPEPAVLLAIEDVTERQQIAETRFQRLFETAADGIAVVNGETGTVEDINACFLTMAGRSREDIVGKHLTEVGTLLGMAAAAEILPETRESEIVRKEDAQLTTAAGEVIDVDIVANRYMVGTQPVVQLNIRDVSARKQAAAALRESEERYRMVIESVHDYAIFQMDLEGKITSWNSGGERLLGWPEREIMGKSASVVFVPEDVAKGEPEHEMEQARTEGRAVDERWHLRKDGSRFFASGVLARVTGPDGSLVAFTKVMQDITTRKEQESQLQRSLDEKNTLIREIHHRVKNNLQMIVSLLSLHANHTTDARVLGAYEEAKGRVRVIAQIHEQLYASDDLREVEFGSYLRALANDLVALHAGSPEGLRLEVEADEMVFAIEKAIPLGLIANELVLNSLKHGLRERTGKLRVALVHTQPETAADAESAGGWAYLRVEDSGAGFPQSFDAATASSMGYRLVNLLVKQLRGRLEIANTPGAQATLWLPRSRK